MVVGICGLVPICWSHLDDLDPVQCPIWGPVLTYAYLMCFHGLGSTCLRFKEYALLV